MRILFAVSNDNITTMVVNKYQQKYKEIITSKNVYYFNAIIKELQKNKSYDAIVIGEDLEPISNNNYEAIDKFLFEKLDGISDEASKPTGEDIPIIFICSDRRTQSDQLLIKLFGIGIYNAIIGKDRSIDTVCSLINKPRNKKEAKAYYKVESEKVGPYERENDEVVSENEIQNILSHYRKIGANEKKCVESFDRIAEQYTDTQLRLIIKFLPNNVKSILENNSSKYQKLMTNGTVLSNGTYQTYQRPNYRKPGTIDFLTKDLEKTTMSKPVIIPSTINLEKGVKREDMSETNNNMINENVQETIKKRGRGRPKKVAVNPVPTQVPNMNQAPTQMPNMNQAPMQMPNMNQAPMQMPNMNQAPMQMPNMNQAPMQVPNMNQAPTQAPNMNQAPMQAPNMNQAPMQMPNMNQAPTQVPNMNQAPTQVPNMNQAPMQTPNNEQPPTTNQEQNTPSNQEPKRRRGRPPKQSVVPTPVEQVPTTQTPVVSEPTAPEINKPQPTEEQSSNVFDDILLGLEEPEDSVNLFSMDPIEDSTKETESAVLPGFDNDIENMNTTENQTNSNDMNLFDLDIEENPSSNDTNDTNLYDMGNYNNMNNSNSYETNNYDSMNNSNPYEANNYDSMNNSNPYETNNYDSMNNSNPYEANNYDGMNNNYSLTNTTPYSAQDNNPIAGNGKIVAFVGTTKNGTSFIVNNLAQLLSQNGVNTAILDLTKNKNSYYMFTDNDANLMKKATDSIKNLSNGIVDGLNVNKHLTIFTSLPDEMQDTNSNVMLKTLSNNFEVILLDCDFETESAYFVSANEIYLIQSMDTFTIQPLTQFLSDLKLKNMLDESKLRVVINKYVRLRKLNENLIIGGMSKYNEPAMTLQRDLFNAQTIKHVTIPFEMDTYARYLESIAMCSLSLNGYSQSFLMALEELKNMVYPLISGGNTNRNSQNNTEEKHGLFGGKKVKQQVQTTQFSNDVNDTLNRMRTNNF